MFRSLGWSALLCLAALQSCPALLVPRQASSRPSSHLFALKKKSNPVTKQIAVDQDLKEEAESFDSLFPSYKNRDKKVVFKKRSSKKGSPTAEEPELLDRRQPIESVKAVVCGGGPAGLLSAIMLAQKTSESQKIWVYDRLAPPPHPDDEAVWSDVEKFYLIGLGGRGQTALSELGAWEGTVKERCVPVVGRYDWQPGQSEGTESVFTKAQKRQPTQVLPRDKLVGALVEHIKDKYADRIELLHGYEVQPVDFEHEDGKSVLVRVTKCSSEISERSFSEVKTATEKEEETLCDVDGESKLLLTNLLVASDGAVRTVANAMEHADEDRYSKLNILGKMLSPKPFRVKRYEDDNQRVYKSISIKIPKDKRHDLNYSARSKRATFEALPADKQGNYCGIVLFKRDDPLAQADSDPAELREMFDKDFPFFSTLVNDKQMAIMARKPVSYLPGFRYSGPRLHQGGHCILVGDCAHTVKPYFGLGANSALEDALVLGQFFDKFGGTGPTKLPRAIKAFSRRRAAESKALVRISRDLDHPGKLGLVTFLIPIILDGVFSKLPFFKPNVIQMLQREEYTFTQVGRIKRLDRLGQLALLSGMAAGAGYLGSLASERVISLFSASLKCSPELVRATGWGFIGGMFFALLLSTRFGKKAE